MSAALASVIIAALVCATALAALFVFMWFTEKRRSALFVAKDSEKISELENRLARLETARALGR